jgi:hypothetical protein
VISVFRNLRVPPGPIIGAVIMSGLAFTLVVIIIARSPYTHGNLSPEGYDRTEVIRVGEEQPFPGIGLKDSGSVLNGDPVHDGRILFFSFGCASCHGLTGQDGTVGGRIDTGDVNLSELIREVRRGPKGMPSFVEEVLSDEEAERLHTFLESIEEASD